jgi:peptidyl-tRNA hydrolase
MARDRAAQAADALLMAYAATINGDDDAISNVVLTCYGDVAQASSVAQAGTKAGVALADHLVLELRLLTALVQATGRRPDDLLREVTGG